MALQLVKLTNGRAELQEDALCKVLLSDAARDRPVMVVSVIGAYRRGKSFLLNFLLRYLKAGGAENWMGKEDAILEGFEWNFGENRVTTGINVWPEVFVIGEVAVVLIDTQGTFDKETSLKDNSSIVAITALLSSVQILNISERFESHDLTNLEFFLEYGKMMQETNANEACGGLKLFQKIIFLIRDWKFEDNHSWGFEGGREYLKEFIRPDSGPINKDFESVREMLNSCFQKVECCLLPHPGDDVSKSTKFQGQLGEIEVDFKRELRSMVMRIFDPKAMMKKQIAGREVTGKQLLHHTRVYVGTLNSGALPEPKTMFNILSDEVARALLTDSKNLYLTLMQERQESDADKNDLQILHEECRCAALSNFDQGRKLGALHHTQTFRNMLLEQINDEYQRFNQFVDINKDLKNLQQKWKEEFGKNENMRCKIDDLKCQIEGKHEKIEEQKDRITDLQRKVENSEKRTQECEEQVLSLQEKYSNVLQKQTKRTGEWVSARNGFVPAGAFRGGTDHDCEIMVIRAFYEGDLLPGKLVPTHGVAYVCWGGKEYVKHQYEVLCNCDCKWVKAHGNRIPANALSGGKTKDGETLFMGRVPHNGTVTLGKVHLSHSTCYIPYDGKEFGFPDYEILVE